MLVLLVCVLVLSLVSMCEVRMSALSVLVLLFAGADVVAVAAFGIAH